MTSQHSAKTLGGETVLIIQIFYAASQKMCVKHLYFRVCSFCVATSIFTFHHKLIGFASLSLLSEVGRCTLPRSVALAQIWMLIEQVILQFLTASYCDASLVSVYHVTPTTIQVFTAVCVYVFQQQILFFSQNVYCSVRSVFFRLIQ